MEILIFLLAWPFLLLVVALVLLAAFDFTSYGVSHAVINYDDPWRSLPTLIIFVIFALIALKAISSRGNGWAEIGGQAGEARATLEAKKTMYMVSIAALLPLGLRYALKSMNTSLASVLAALVIAFVAVLFGTHIKGNKVLARGNVVGGMFGLFYVFFCLWQLGQGARIIAAAAGFVMAIGFAVAKFKDKLV